MEDLIKRIEEADGPDWVLDAEIACALKIGENIPDWAKNWGGEWRPSAYGSFVLWCDDGSAGPNFEPPHYTSSIDAAMTLVPHERKPMLIQQPCGKWSAAMFTVGNDDQDPCMVEGMETPALALCAAALRARNG